MDHKIQRFFKILMLIILTALVTFIVTTIFVYKSTDGFSIKLGTKTQTTEATTLATKLAYYKQFIDQHYLYDTDEEKMEEEAIKGFFEGLDDEFSQYITKEEMKSYMADATGKYVGIGVYIANNTKTDQVIVLTPIKGTPAEKAGIKAGDIIVKVDGIEYKGSQLIEVSNKLKGDEGTIADVELLRNGETINVKIERNTIKLNFIDSKVLEDDIGYIGISSFDDGTCEEFLSSYQSLKEQGIKSLIIDLRDNGGGIVSEATDIADLFTDKDTTLLITASKNNKEVVTKAKKDKEIDIPVVVLINENTASSSEILAAALKENNDSVKIIGKTSYGKGVIQSIYTLKDGSGIKLTTEEYFTPKRNSLNKVGIKPDIEVSMPEANDVSELANMEDKDDTQLQKAIEVLKNR